MARFSTNTIKMVGGVDQPIIAEELLFGQDTYWNWDFKDAGTGDALDLTGWTFQLRLIRRQVNTIVDGRNGIEFPDGIQAATGATTMNLDTSIKVFNPANGQVRILINDDFFSQLPPMFDSTTPPVYTGYFGAIIPPVGVEGNVDYIPQQMKKVLLLFIIDSDGISSQANT